MMTFVNLELDVREVIGSGKLLNSTLSFLLCRSPSELCCYPSCSDACHCNSGRGRPKDERKSLFDAALARTYYHCAPAKLS